MERYFASQGITTAQFHGEFHGESEPAMPCEMECSVCPDDIRWANRRTEFIVTNQPQAFAPSCPPLLLYENQLLPKKKAPWQ